jgi:Domain of unknown function (DUF4410)
MMSGALVSQCVASSSRRTWKHPVSWLIKMVRTTMMPMKSYANAIGLLLMVAMLAGCASTKVNEQTPMTAPGLARPNQIWVYDFVAAPSDMPADSSLAGQVGAPSTPPTPEELETGRKFGAMIAQQLVIDIQQMGMPATAAGPGSAPQVGDGVIRGYIVSTQGGGTGAMAKRMVIGFGAGTAEMDTVVEGFLMTPQGLRRLGSGTLSSSGNKTPGLVAPAAVAIATGNPVGLIVVGGLKVYGAASGRSGLEGRAKSTADEIAVQLKIRFQDRGWIAQD